MDSQRPGKEHSAGRPQVSAQEAIAQALARLRYGAINLTVHEGKVVQIDVTERQRFS